MSTFYGLPPVGGERALLTHLVVREDAHVLYGFATDDRAALFRDLLRSPASGRRSRSASSPGISVDAFLRSASPASDATALTRIPGIGRKTAERLLVEMRRIRALGGGAAGGAGAALATAMRGGPQGEAFAALVALGYKPAEATRLIKAAMRKARSRPRN